jgi:hypothetical protein
MKDFDLARPTALQRTSNGRRRPRRQRHSGRRQKIRPRFPHTQVTTPTVTGPVTITRFHPEWVAPQAADTS